MEATRTHSNISSGNPTTKMVEISSCPDCSPPPPPPACPETKALGVLVPVPVPNPTPTPPPPPTPVPTFKAPLALASAYPARTYPPRSVGISLSLSLLLFNPLEPTNPNNAAAATGLVVEFKVGENVCESRERDWDMVLEERVGGGGGEMRPEGEGRSSAVGLEDGC